MYDAQVVTDPTTVDGKISKPKKQRAPITRGRARKDKGLAAPTPIPTPTPKEPSTFAKSVEKTRDFAKKDPVAAYTTYDLGKGILSKIMKLRTPSVQGGRAIQVSAGK